MKNNLERFTSRFKASAEAAASAARSFQGFDEMAARDDYIHTDGLNVRKQKPTAERAVAVPLSLPTPSTNVQTNESDSDSESDNDNDDPILALMRKDDATDVSSLSMRSESERTKKHRFLEDLEDRMAKPITPSVSPLPSSPSVPPMSISVQESPQLVVASFLNKLGVPVKPVTATRTPPPTVPPPPLARPKRKPPTLEQEDFHVTVSTNVLAAEELEQLQQLQQPKSLWREHSREVFIAATLVLGIVIYFYVHGAGDGVS